MIVAMAFLKGIITINDLKNTAEESRAKLLGNLLRYMASEYGPQFVRDVWQRSQCKWEHFDRSVNEFLDTYVRSSIH